MTASSISAMSAYADRLEVAKVGYDQGQRWSFNPSRDGRTVTANGEGDCSSTCAAILRAGGVPIDTSDPIWTGNFAAKARAAGCEIRSVSGWSMTRLRLAAREGDLLVGPGHVVYVRKSGLSPSVWSAESDERGRSSGGKSGDQTGREARFRALYARSRGWATLIRPPANAAPLVSAKPSKPSVFKPAALVVDGDRGPLTIKALQRHLNKQDHRRRPLVVDGQFGPKTKRAMQKWLRVRADGKVGPITVRALQRKVGADVDGVWGPQTTRKLQQFLNGQR